MGTLGGKGLNFFFADACEIVNWTPLLGAVL